MSPATESHLPSKLLLQPLPSPSCCYKPLTSP
uniref:Uncharacterized protein n=1 Tax=Arundo donax TaxID=35708 RepID=A0A0A8YEW0_ARUDO